MTNRFLILLIILIIGIGIGCKENQKKPPSTSITDTKKKLEHVNKTLVDKDKEIIEAYITRHKLDGMEQNKSGLFYLVWGETSGPKVQPGYVVVLNYKISLLNGTECYSSGQDKPKEFLVGHGGVEAGLEMAVLLMHEGQKGKFIMPPHLGHGLLGDNEKIPPLAILVYDVELLNVIEN